VVTIAGVPADSRFARVMLSADFLMKRVAMNFEPAPVEGLPSYLELLTASSAPPPRTMTPRWWLAPDHALQRDAAGVAWEFRERGIKTLTDDDPARSLSPAQQWADRFTSRYEQLSVQWPIFAELQNCIDLAVVAAIIAKEDLRTAAGFEMDLLLDAARAPTGSYPTPKSVPAQASVVSKGNGWIVSISGGVEFDPWRLADANEQTSSLAAPRAQATPPADGRWWWD
jgi:hypothetical protein